MENTQFRFRCKENPAVIYQPEFLFDVETMRKHPDYEEVDEHGEVVKPAHTIADDFDRIPVKAAVLAEPTPANKPGRKK